MPYKRKRKNRTEWVADVMKKGKRYFKVFPTKTKALSWEAMIRSTPEEDLTTPSESLKLIDWVNQYLEFAESKFVAKTFDEKRSCFKRFFQRIEPTMQVERLKPAHLLDHLQKEAKARSGYAANKDRKNLVAAWNWGIKYLGLPTANPCLVDTFPEQRQTRYIPPEKDFWKVYDCASGQDKTMLLAYLHLAARKSELFRLKWEDVDFARSLIRLGTRKRKGGSLEYDWLPMTEELRVALIKHKTKAHEEWVFVDPESEKPFQYRLHFMRRICKRAGVKPFGFHAIRHLTASILAQADIPMVTIQAVLRHKNLTTTERYIRGLESVRPALDILSKRHSRPQSRPKVVELQNEKKPGSVTTRLFCINRGVPKGI